MFLYVALLHISQLILFLKDGENITEELKDRTGNFENFQDMKDENGMPVKDHLNFKGIALIEHRGNYTCQVDLRNNSTEGRHLYPVHFSYFVRIKGYTETFKKSLL